MKETFDKIVNKRRAYREFDTKVKIPAEVVENSLKNAILSPNSSNMQLWEFYRIRSPKALKEVAEICLNQPGAKTASEIVVFVSRPDLWKKRQAAHLKRLENIENAHVKNKLFGNSEYTYFKDVMPMFYNRSFAFFRDLYKRIYIWNKGRKAPFMTDIFDRHIPIVAHKSVALAAQTFMLGIVSQGYDSLPMEGLDAKRMKKFLGLPKTADINMAIAVGKGTPAGLRGKRFRMPYDEVVFEL